MPSLDGWHRAQWHPDFLAAWDAFMARFGTRGPVEMDLATPRYQDDPRIALSQMAALAGGDGDLETRHTQLVEDREAALQELVGQVGALHRPLLRYAQHLASQFAGTRDTPKHILTLYNYRVRQRALEEGHAFVDAGRLDAPEHIFDLHLEQLPEARRNLGLDLRALRAENIAFLQQLREARVTFPPVIDSRGRILAPRREDAEPGSLRGLGVSGGTGRGRVRLLRRPDGASIVPGEVLVAYTTDPGWTPLFLHAAAVILEIGGTLQHGALVAREYGTPCVVGVHQVLKRLREGQLVEVDGTAGRIRILDDGAAGA